METIHLVLKTLIKIAIVLVIIILVWWGTSIFYPDLKVKNLLGLNGTSTKSTTGWLPYPGSFSGLFGKASTPNENSNLYVHPDENVYNGTGGQYGNVYRSGGANVEFITYSSTGTQVIKQDSGGKQTESSQPYDPREIYIRNISFFKGAQIYKNYTFTGEAKNVMFINGTFPVLVADKNGKIISVNHVEASSDWSVPGWIRFSAKIKDPLPGKEPCTVIFQSAGTFTAPGSQTKEPIRVGIPVNCN